MLAAPPLDSDLFRCSEEWTAAEIFLLASAAFVVSIWEEKRLSSMLANLPAVRPIELAEIREAQQRIAGTILRTPLVRLELGPGFPDIRLKLENLQPINAYKLRGAANAVAMLSDEERKRG